MERITTYYYLTESGASLVRESIDSIETAIKRKNKYLDKLKQGKA